MAIENQELQQAAAEYRNGIQGLDEATKKSTTGMNAFGRASVQAGKDIGRGAAGFAKSLNDGQTDIKSFNSVIDVAAGAVTGMAKAIPVFGQALSALAQGVAEAGKYLVGELDKTSKAFNTVGQSGALGAKGMTGLYEQGTRAGLSLEQYTKQVQASSESLAQFRGLAGDGAEDFSEIVGKLTKDTDNSLRNLGLSAEQMASGAGNFLKRETALGRAQSQTNNQLAAGAKNYLKELDMLARVTGQNKDALVQQQEAALSETRFLAVRQDMEAKGMGKQADALLNFQTVVNNLDKETGQGIRDLSSGIADTEAAQKLLNSTNGKAADIIARLQDGSIGQAQAQRELGVAVEGNMQVMRDQGRFNREAGETYIGLAGATKIQMLASDQSAKALEKGQEQQEQLAKGQDKLTKDVVEAEKQLQKMALAISELNIKALPHAAAAVNTVTSAMAKLAEFINKNLGIDTEAIPGETSYERRAREKHSGKEPKAGEIDTELLNKLNKSGITDKRAQANILAQVQAESGGVAKSENLNYSPEQLLKTFPKHVKSKEDAEALVAKGPEAVGNRIYGGRMGNKEDEGFKYRGRGLIQLTGKDNYAKYGKLLGVDLVGNPDLANDPSIAKDIATAYFAEKQKQGVNLSNISDVGKAVGYVDHGGQETKKRAQLATQLETKLGEPTPPAQASVPTDKKPPPAQASGPTDKTPAQASVSGPTKGYTATVQTTETIVPTDSAKTQTASTPTANTTESAVMTAQLDRLDEMVSLMKNQLDVNTRIMQMGA